MGEGLNHVIVGDNVAVLIVNLKGKHSHLEVGLLQPSTTSLRRCIAQCPHAGWAKRGPCCHPAAPHTQSANPHSKLLGPVQNSTPTLSHLAAMVSHGGFQALWEEDSKLQSHPAVWTRHPASAAALWHHLSGGASR